MAAEARTHSGAAERGLLRSLAAVFQKLRSQAARRLGWGVADQVVSSLTNFATGIYVIHALGAVQFGAFSLAFVTYGFALNASRGLSTDPLMVRFSGTDVLTWRRAVAKSAGTATNVGLLIGVGVLVAAGVLNGAARAAFLALGLTLPALLLQDSWRYSFFTLGRGSQAFLNDSVLGGDAVPRPCPPAGNSSYGRVLVRFRLGPHGGCRRCRRGGAGPGAAQAVRCLGVGVTES